MRLGLSCAMPCPWWPRQGSHQASGNDVVVTPYGYRNRGSCGPKYVPDASKISADVSWGSRHDLTVLVARVFDFAPKGDVRE